MGTSFGRGAGRVRVPLSGREGPGVATPGKKYIFNATFCFPVHSYWKMGSDAKIVLQAKVVGRYLEAFCLFF